MLIAANETVNEIVKELSMLDPLEQQVLLTRLRVKRLQKKRTGTIATIPKGMRKPTLKQIDKWKHESRKVK